MEKSEEDKPLQIFYPSLRFDIETPIQVSEFWENAEVEIYTIVDFDPDHEKDIIEPIGMPMCLEKVQKYIKKYLQTQYNVIEFVEPVMEVDSENENPDDADGSYFDEECWQLKWQMGGKHFTLYYYYGLDPFGDYWPEHIDDVYSFIHTNGPIDLENEEFTDQLLERCAKADVYASYEMAKKFWPESEECYVFVDDENVDEYNPEALYYLGDLKQYIP